ncbi:GNAT family N-acetyltransferase [Pseudomonas gingeri]|nr:GNAT family N-acetyltransferase [Pseudomonas gingeri]
MSMTDPLAALVSLQVEVRRGMPTHPTENYRTVRVAVDEHNGRVRYTYAKIEHGRVKALSMFVTVDPIGGIACFQVGYAVPEAYRGRGWATEILGQGIEELRKGLGRHDVKQFYVEAVVGSSNLASQKVAAKVISQSPLQTTDCYSGEAALAYTRLIEC